MSDVSSLAIEFAASSNRCSREVEPYGRRTLWYGMVCHSFVLLDQVLRVATAELVHASEIEASKVKKTAPRGIDAATMGQWDNALHS